MNEYNIVIYINCHLLQTPLPSTTTIKYTNTDIIRQEDDNSKNKMFNIYITDNLLV